MFSWHMNAVDVRNVAITAEQRRILGPRPGDDRDHDLPIDETAAGTCT